MAGRQPAYGDTLLRWPFPVMYGSENAVEADVLVIGGGLSGSYAAISAAERGLRVAVVDKTSLEISGNAGTGIDHWLDAMTNPCSKITAEERAEAGYRLGGSRSFGHVHYIGYKEAWDALLDAEKWGLEFRDVNDEFAGAPFRDDETKIMFAYDYENRYSIRLRDGFNLKRVLFKRMKELGIRMYPYIKVTALLTEGGRQGARVVGAVGVGTRTGEFYIFKAKASVLTTGNASRLWIYNYDMQGSCSEFSDPNCVGDGFAMAWNAGAEFTCMYVNGRLWGGGAFAYPAYGCGNSKNTWFPCSLVDASGKEIPWYDVEGKPVTRVEDRGFLPSGYKYFSDTQKEATTLAPDLPDRLRRGEFRLPLYADLPGMPEYERRAIWGLMVGNEGKTRTPIYNLYSQWGFDPTKDLLQVNMQPLEFYRFAGWWFGAGPKQWKEAGIFSASGGIVVDWDLKTSLEGLYSAGMIALGAGAAGAAATGRYAGRAAAEYALKAAEPAINRAQVEREKAAAYEPLRTRRATINWKELHAGICRIMQDYCGDYLNEDVLRTGLWWLKSVRESEYTETYARNPHELVRVLEQKDRLVVGEMFMYGCLTKLQADQKGEGRDAEGERFVVNKLVGEEVEVRYLPAKFWLKQPYVPEYKKNYLDHCRL